MRRRRYDWEQPLLCTPTAVDSEEEELLRLLAQPHSKAQHKALVERWQAMLYAKEQLEEMAQPNALEPTTTTTATSGCISCLSTPCSCERYER